MGAAEQIRLEGKDWFTEAEAAEYCGVARTETAACAGRGRRPPRGRAHVLWR